MHYLLAAPTLPLCTALAPAAGKQLNYLTGVVVKPVKEPVQVRAERLGRSNARLGRPTWGEQLKQCLHAMSSPALAAGPGAV